VIWSFIQIRHWPDRENLFDKVDTGTKRERPVEDGRDPLFEKALFSLFSVGKDQSSK
jgi:hypothetical protein